MVLFDTHLYYKTLTEKGFSPDQADALTEANDTVFKIAVEQELATKDDIRRLENRIGSLESKFDALEGRIGNLESKFDTLEGRINALEGRINALEGRIGNLENKFDALEGRINALEGRIGNLENKFDALGVRIGNLEKKMATKDDLDVLHKNFHNIDKQVNLIKWILGVIMLAVVIPLLKQFF